MKTLHLVFAGTVVGLMGWAVGGPEGTLAGPLFAYGLAAYNLKLQADHDRRQQMLQELDAMLDTLIGQLGV